jgi:hypothetical protein
MTASDWKKQLRADLERAGEQAVRDDVNFKGGLSTGGEDRRLLIREWLREKEKSRQAREAALFDLTKTSLVVTQRTYAVALAALIATIGGIIIALLHL